MSRLHNKRGQIIVWMTFLLPFLMMLIAFFVNLMVLVNVKIHLQSTLDRAVYAGADHLANIMNEIGRLNWKFRREFIDKRDRFAFWSEDKKRWIDAQAEEVRRNQAILEREMIGLIQRGYSEADQIVRKIVAMNLGRLNFLTDIQYHPAGSGIPGREMFRLVDDRDENGNRYNWVDVTAIEIKGESLDPSDYTNHEYSFPTYLIKAGDISDHVALAGHLTVNMIPPIASTFFAGEDRKFQLETVAAAQPYRGSIKKFALIDVSSLLEATNIGSRYQYIPALIPFRDAVGGSDVQH